MELSKEPNFLSQKSLDAAVHSIQRHMLVHPNVAEGEMRAAYNFIEEKIILWESNYNLR